MRHQALLSQLAAHYRRQVAAAVGGGGAEASEASSSTDSSSGGSLFAPPVDDRTSVLSVRAMRKSLSGCVGRRQRVV